MIRKRNIFLAVSIILLCASLLLGLKINYFMRENSKTNIPLKSTSVINKKIIENNYKYCDIIKISSKYGIKMKKVMFKDNIWHIEGSISGDYNSVRSSMDLLKQQNIMFDINSVNADKDNLDVELEMKIK